MGISESKLIADRANTQKSTGPRTPEGKARVRLNALEHGILASEVLIQAGEGDEEAEVFEAVLAEPKDDLAPAGALEELLVGKLAVIVWQWRRVLRYELGAMREQTGEAVAVWRREQHTAYLRAKAMREEYPSCHRNDPSLKEWKHTEDLKGERKDGRKRAEALAEADPLVGSGRGLRERLNVK